MIGLTTRILANPFVVYCLTFGGTLCIYQLGWSEIMPPITSDTWTFFGITFVIAAQLAVFTQPLVQSVSYTPLLLPRFSWIFILATMLAEIALNGIPMLRVSRGENFYELEAGARHLHMFFFWSVFSVIRFADFLYTKRFRYLLEATLTVIAFGVFVYRGPALILLMAWAFVYILVRGLTFQRASIAVVVALAVLFINGKIGDIRSPGHEKLTGAPSAAFKKSGIPSTYFWSYLYVTVPIGNLQLSVDKLNPDQGSWQEFLVTEFIPDTFSKRIAPHLNDKIQIPNGYLGTRDQLYSWEQPRVGHGMNISSIFGRSYGYFGWAGATIMFGVLSLFVTFYSWLASRTPYGVPALALLNTLVVFCLFNNMLVSAPMIPLLVIILLLPPWHWLRPRNLFNRQVIGSA